MNFNVVILGGRLTRNVELKYLPNQTAIAEFGMAVNKKYVSNGEKKEKACFVDLTCFGPRAEVLNKYVSKGDELLVRGELSFESWQSKDGTKRSKLKVTIENFEFVGGKQDGQQRQPDKQQSGGYGGGPVDDIPF